MGLGASVSAALRMRSECGSSKWRSKLGIRAGKAHHWEKAYFKTHGKQRGSDEKYDKWCPPGYTDHKFKAGKRVGESNRQWSCHRTSGPDRF